MDNIQTFEDKIRGFIARNGLFAKADRLLVALSGGSDSVSLLRVLLRLGYDCEAAHCNFHLRGPESVRDEEFVLGLCRQLGVCLHVIHFDTVGYSRQHHVSLEMAARELRYGWFERIRQLRSARCVAVAHHEDDSIETFLLNLMRGTGINGLRGIRPKNGPIVRPLLCVGRRDIEAYLRAVGQAWVTDSTNLEANVARNKVRLDLLPVMERISPSVRQSILRTAANLDSAAAIYNKGVDEGRRRVMTGGGISIGALLREPSPQALLHEIVSPLGFNAAQTATMLSALRSPQPGKLFVSPTHVIVRDRDLLVISPRGQEQVVELSFERVNVTPGFLIPRDRRTACLDADKLRGDLSVRPWRQGDWFVPFGMSGRKLVSDFLTDQKLSRLAKQRQQVLLSGDDIVWVVGLRSDNRFRLDATSRHALIVSVVRD